MKITYRINHFSDGIETRAALYCVEIGEMAVETRGEIVCTEQDALEDVLAGTPWADAKSLDFAMGWPEATVERLAAINSASMREWIAAKEG